MITTGVVAGRVLEVRPHPNGERIRLANVDIGDDRKVQIVFGGRLDVVRPGCLVPVAVPGSRLRPGVKKMRRRNYRGQSSYGMLCSPAEMGWDHSVTDEVAVLRNVLPGDSLDRYEWDYWSILENHEPVPAVVIRPPAFVLAGPPSTCVAEHRSAQVTAVLTH